MIDSKELQPSHVVHNVAEQRFELRVGEDLSVIDYGLVPGKLVIYHTGVPPQLRGRGIAARITRAALDFARVTCRRAERHVATLKDPNSEILRYLNRLSDFCWLLARYMEKRLKHSDNTSNR